MQERRRELDSLGRCTPAEAILITPVFPLLHIEHLWICMLHIQHFCTLLEKFFSHVELSIFNTRLTQVNKVQYVLRHRELDSLGR